MILTNSQRSWPFIADVLSAWAQWRGFPSVGMGRIIWGHLLLSAVIGMLISASLLMALRTVDSFKRQKRAGFRLLRVSTAAILLGILIWCACQEYSFCNLGFSGFVRVAWGGGSSFLDCVAVVGAVTRILKESRINANG